MKSLCRSIAIVGLLALFLPIFGWAQDERLASSGMQPMGFGSVPAGSDGPNVWYWPTGKGDSDFVSENSPAFPEYYVGASITVGQAGTATKLAAKVRNTSNSTKTLKIYLLSAADAVLASGTVVVPNNQGTPAWAEVTINYSVTATTYKVLSSMDDGAHECYNWYDSGANGWYSETDYPSDPASISTDTGFLHGVKIYVD